MGEGQNTGKTMTADRMTRGGKANGGKTCGDSALWGLSTGTIKLFACATMLFDHFVASLLAQRFFSTGKLSILQNFPNLDYESARKIVTNLRLVGRPAFLLYAFFLTFGLTKTRNKLKYLGRLLLLALVSEVPFDMALRGKIFDINHQNVFFTLSIGLIVIWITEKCINHIKKLKRDLIKVQKGRNIHKKQKTGKEPTKSVNAIKIQICKNIFYILLTLFVGIELATALKTDYSFMGVTVIFIMYLFNQGYRFAAYGIMIVSPIFNSFAVVLWYLIRIFFKSFGPNAAYLPNSEQILSFICGNIKLDGLRMLFCTLIVFYFVIFVYATKAGMAVFTGQKGRFPDAGVFFYSSLLGSLFLFVINNAEITAFVGSVLLLFFSGRKGWNNKWFFYLFYPVHLLILGLIMIFTG